MTPEEMLAALTALTDKITADVAEKFAVVQAKCDALDEKMKKADTKKKADGDDDAMAEQTAADRRADSVSRDQLQVLQRQVNDLVQKSPRARTQADNDAFADAQSKADAVLRTHNERASPPMQGEELADYLIRLHRPMQVHSARFAKAQLATIAADSTVFSNVLAQIRADAYEAGVRPVNLPLFQHREIKTESPGGHKISTFHGNGTIFAQMAAPVRRVIGIAGDNRYSRSGGGAVHVRA
jgi:hypothetical protein